MKLKKVISLAAAAAICSTMAYTTAFAAKFADVTDANYGWAVEAVDSMAADKIILGYEDGTFRPANTVTKLESLVLAARILGVNDSENKELIDVFTEKYGADIEKYDIAYGSNELAYLLGKNIISTSELADYIGSTNASQGLKRYELAVLLTKAMGAEETVKKNLASVLSYSDESSIPSFAKKYVEYVTEQGLMQGMSATEFSPNTEVTRAQMAVVLYKLKNNAGFEKFSAIVTNVDSLLGVIKLKGKDDEPYGYTVKDDVALRFEGEKITLDDVSIGYECVITTKKASLFSIDFITPDVEESFRGSISSIKNNSKTGTSTIKFNKFLDSGDKEVVEYTTAENVNVTYEGEKSTVTALKSGDYAEVTLKKGKITLIAAKPKTETVKGTVKEIYTSDLGVYVKLTDVDDKEVSYIAGSDITVNKNGTASAALSEVRTGDSVSMTLEYGFITKIIATSKTSNTNGFIEEINISASPSVKIKLNGESKTYPLSSDVVITVNGTSGTIYDLRLSTTAKITLESDTIVKIDTSPIETITQITGTVDLVNASYGLVQMTYYDAVTAQNITQSVFVGKATKIINNSTGKEATLKTITSGMSVTAIGSVKSGVFEATTIIVLG
ncbi:S-layer homology domain-containing protein [Qingrenia yutianensis]|uniref:S-layer homology domain-containing protein n=1 Tax=Qingrenia yutianensis TaxID=2763676 RepID=A0A926IRN5_9FIRM|nr:S-layer homology domain-containing protein [Qingrenia yutianensis]MBC8595559.1 S-layer homology domain-containing protein [Qingrenia yutianensis]